MEASVIVAARLFSMISIDEIDFCISPGRCIEWKEGPLVEAIKAEFQISKVEGREMLPKIFKVVNLARLAGIKVGRTSNWLIIFPRKETKSLFHYVEFIELHRASSRAVV